jgi:hypothetical protein
MTLELIDHEGVIKVMLPVHKYKKLLEAAAKWERLEEHDVDQWHGYDAALEGEESLEGVVVVQAFWEEMDEVLSDIDAQVQEFTK